MARLLRWLTAWLIAVALLPGGAGAVAAQNPSPKIPAAGMSDDWIVTYAPKSRSTTSRFSPADPVWYDVYVVGLNTDGGQLWVGNDMASRVNPEDVTLAMVQHEVQKADDYFNRNTQGAVRLRLVSWQPFQPSGGSCSDQSHVFDDVNQRAGVNSVTSNRNVVIGVTTCRDSFAAGRAWQNGEVLGINIYGNISGEVWGHEFGHSRLNLHHQSWSRCGNVNDALIPCPGFRDDSYIEYWGTSVMASDVRYSDPLLPPHLSAIGLLNPDNTMFFPNPPATPVDVTISDLPLTSGTQVIQLGRDTNALFISRSASTSSDTNSHLPVVQVTQSPRIWPDSYRALVLQAGQQLRSGDVQCGTTGFCAQVLSETDHGATVRIWKNDAPPAARPQNVVASVDDASRVHVRWEQPAGSALVNGYDVDLVRVRPDAPDDHELFRVEGSQTTFDLPDSWYGNHMQFRVSAHTSEGVSDFTALTDPVSNLLPPSPPAISWSQTRGKTGEVSLYLKCADRGAPVDDYLVQYTDDTSKPVDQWTVTDSQWLTGLKPHVDYWVEGRCHNARGWSEPGQTGFWLHDAPRQPHVTQWTYDWGPDGLVVQAGMGANPWGDPETGSKVTLSPGGASCEGGTDGYLATTCAVKGLPSSRQFTARIVLTSIYGESPPQFLTVGTEARPDQPSGVKLSLNDQGQAVVSWNPTQGLFENPVVHYTVTVNDQLACDTTETRCVLPSMAAGSENRILVSAYTLGGASVPWHELYFPKVTTLPPPPPVSGNPATPGGKPSTGTSPNPTTSKQTLSSAPTKVAQRRSVRLPGKSRQLAPITWRSLTPKTCRVHGLRLHGRVVGKCRVRGSAAAAGSYAPTTTWTLSVKVVPRVRPGR